MSYGIIFMGRGGLNIEDFARFVESHYMSDEYLVQGTAYNKAVRQRIAKMRQSPEFLQYIASYKRMVVSNKVSTFLMEIE